MRFWLAHAFLRYLLFFAAGILLYIYLPDILGDLSYWVFSLFFAFAILSSTLKKEYFFHLNAILGITACSFLFCLGYQHMYYFKEANNDAHLLNSEVEYTHYHARVVDRIEEKTNSWKTILEISQLKEDSFWRPTETKVLAYFSKSAQQIPRYGDVILVQGKVNEMNEPSNPHEFNFKRFISFQNIHHQHFIRESDFIIIENKPKSILRAKANDLRNYFAETLERKVVDAGSYQIAKALVLGIKDDLDSEITRAYAAAGAMHVLAVSGLHVGIVYGFLLLLIGKWKNHPRLRWAFLVICISFLWSYALITGLSPSVKRAATMFSFIVLSQVLIRNSNIYNTLAASAFFLLCFDPYLLMSVGFQLSYLAVLGIVYLQPKIYHSVFVQNRFLDKVWAITCVSIAAQLATAPLGLLYFHQFPTYFFVSNLIVIPAAFVILCGGLATLVFSVFPLIGDYLGIILNHFIGLINYLVSLIEKLPESTIEGVLISTPQSWMLYLCVISLFLFVEMRKLSYLFSAIIFISLFQFENLNRIQEQSLTHQFRVYKVNGHSAWEIQKGGKHFIVLNDELKENEDQLKFHVFPQHLEMGLTRRNNANIQPKEGYQIKPLERNLSFGKLYLYEHQSILHWDKRIGKDMYVENPPIIDKLIISKNAVNSVDEILKVCQPKFIILDSSNKTYWLYRLKEGLEKLNLPYHDVNEKGAYIKRI